MANTKNLVYLQVGQKKVVSYFTLVCVGNAQETNTVLYSSSTISNSSNLNRTDPKKCKLCGFDWQTNTSSGIMQLNFDATTPVLALSVPNKVGSGTVDFREVGYLVDYAGTGVTGDITLTTTGLATGESLSIVLTVEPY